MASAFSLRHLLPNRAAVQGSTAYAWSCATMFCIVLLLHSSLSTFFLKDCTPHLKHQSEA
jgi:hypothetical protein